MRSLLTILILAFSLVQPLAAELPVTTDDEEVYSLGGLEVTGRDLSRPELGGGNRQAHLLEHRGTDQRIERRLVSLGQDRIVLAARNTRSGTVDAAVGNYGTVRLNAQLSCDEGERLGFHYESSDGWRETSDWYRAGLEWNDSRHDFFGQNGELAGRVNYERIQLPGATGFETRALERRHAALQLDGILRPDPERPDRKLEWTMGGAQLRGRQGASGLDEDGSLHQISLKAESRLETRLPLTARAELQTSGLTVRGADDHRISAGRIILRGEREYARRSLLSLETGLEAGGGEGLSPRLDLTLRRRQAGGGDLRLSLGRKARSWNHDELLRGSEGYISLTNAAGANRFATLNEGRRTVEYLHAAWNHSFAAGGFTAFAEAEAIHGERIYTEADIRDARLDVTVSAAQVDRRAIGFRYVQPVTADLRLSLEGSRESVRDRLGDLPFRPQGHLILGLDWNHEGTRAWMRVQGSDGWKVDRGTRRVAGRALTELGIERILDHGIRAGLRMENAFNQYHESRPGMPGRGRLTSATCSWRF